MKQKKRAFLIKLCCTILATLGILGSIFISIDDYANFKFHIKKDVNLHTLLDLFNIKTDYTPQTAEGALTIWEIDVGQGKSILIKSGASCALIDAGDVEYGTTVLNFLRQKQVKQLDYMIITHPHADHIGGAKTVLEEIPVTTVMLPKLKEDITPTGNIFGDFLDILASKKIQVVNPAKETSFNLGSSSLEILSDYNEEFDLNNSSIVTKIKYKNFAFLSTGDIEKQAEEQLLNNPQELKSDILDIAHHGSQTSTSLDFLDAVKPNAALISVGVNDYGHPSPKVIWRLRKRNIPYYCTNNVGTIQVTVSDDYYSILNSKGVEIKKVPIAAQKAKQ
jgi:competence protein ComEC